MLRKFINGNIWLSQKFDNLLPIKFKIDGNQDYIKSLVPKYLKNNIIVYDIGGGKNPYLSCSEKIKLNAQVIGIDIDHEELQRAPVGAYNKIICADITEFRGSNDADFVFCQALLEHVKDVESAFSSISSLLKSGGIALIFVPSRNAVFARLNIILPQKIKKYLLHTIFPDSKRNQGFPSYYDKCTPAGFEKLAKNHNLSIVEQRFYYISSYFSFFFPAHLVWRVWVLFFYFIAKDNAAETFSVVLKK